jgi:diguanylate cyclase (GGDEF)-like protein
VRLEGHDELGQLAQRFNAMAEALEKSRATIEQRASQLDAINQTAVAINSSLQLKDILEEIMRRGIALTGARASCIAFYDEAAGRFTNWVTQGLSEHFVRNMDFRPGGLADEAFTTAGFVLSNDRPDTPHKLSKLTHEEGFKSFVCMPLTSRERRLGVIYFYRVDRDTFTPTEIELLHTFASLAAQAIENARLYARTLEQATTDPLTGVSNRLKFNRELAVEIARSTRYGTPLALVMVDIDHFKAVNDTHGHQVGDRVLVGVSRITAGHIRQTDLLARWGGEEFMILAANCGGQEADRLAEKLRRLINEAAFDEVGSVTCSFGVTQFQDGDTAETLTSRADEALYAAKRAGRNRVCSLGPEQSMEKRQ